MVLSQLWWHIVTSWKRSLLLDVVSWFCLWYLFSSLWCFSEVEIRGIPAFFKHFKSTYGFSQWSVLRIVYKHYTSLYIIYKCSGYEIDINNSLNVCWVRYCIHTVRGIFSYRINFYTFQHVNIYCRIIEKSITFIQMQIYFTCYCWIHISS